MSRNDSRWNSSETRRTFNDTNRSRFSAPPNNTLDSQLNSTATPFNSTLRDPNARNASQTTNKFGDIPSIPVIPPQHPQGKNTTRPKQRITELKCHWCVQQNRAHNHSLDTCAFFQRQTSEEKWNMIMQNRICMWCLELHQGQKCPKTWAIIPYATSATIRTIPFWDAERISTQKPRIPRTRPWV